MHVRGLLAAAALLAGCSPTGGAPATGAVPAAGTMPATEASPTEAAAPGLVVQPAPAGPAPAPALSPAPAPASPAPAPTAAALPTLPLAPPAVVVPYRIEVRTTDAATQDFAAVARATLEDARGWQQAGFDLVEDPAAPYLLVIAEGPEVDGLCLPYRTRSTYSCQNSGVVAFNADRWRSATPQFTGDLETYRRYLVNHEVGHLLGQRHVRCPGQGQPSPIMVQQSTELDGCGATAWPLADEIVRAALHDEPIAPGPDD